MASWLRLWHDMPNDPKWRTIARISSQPIALVQATYLHLLVTASRNVTRGHVDVTNEDLASALDVTEEAIASIIDAMQGRVMEGSVLSGWEKRQPAREDAVDAGSKTAAERKRDQRERQKQANVTNVTNVTENVTRHEMSRNVTKTDVTKRDINTEKQGKNHLQIIDSVDVSQHVTQCHAPDTDTDTDTDTEKKGTPPSQKSAPASPSPECKSPVNGAAIAFASFMDRCKSAGERPIADYAPVWTYAEKVGIPEDAVILAWQEFARKYGKDGGRQAKKYRDWRQAFRNAVEENWLGLWTLDEQGRAVMTAKGRIAEKATA